MFSANRKIQVHPVRVKQSGMYATYDGIGNLIEITYINGNRYYPNFGSVKTVSSVYTITYWLIVRLPYGDILHSLTCAGLRCLSLAHRFKFVFSSSKYVGIRWSSQSTSKNFVWWLICRFVFLLRNNATQNKEITPREKTKKRNNATRNNEITKKRQAKRRNNEKTSCKMTK